MSERGLGRAKRGHPPSGLSVQNHGKDMGPQPVLLITPLAILQAVGSAEYKSFVNGMFPSVSKRTLRYFKKTSKPKNKTINSLISGLCASGYLSEEQVRHIFLSPSPRPWGLALEGVKIGCAEKFPRSFDYAFDIINQIEGAQFEAITAEVQDDARWVDHFKKAGLPAGVMPDSFLEVLSQTGMSKNYGMKKRLIPSDSGKVLLRTYLYVLAALEVSLMSSGLFAPNAGLWIHRRLPCCKDGKILEPMRLFFEDVMRKLEIPSHAQLAERLPPLTLPDKDKDISSQKRQIRRWLAGSSPPSWKYMRLVRDTFPDAGPGDNILIMYGVVRFLQFLLQELRAEIPAMFSGEPELVSIFQEYPQWQEFHQKGFAKWNEARGPSPH